MQAAIKNNALQKIGMNANHNHNMVKAPSSSASSAERRETSIEPRLNSRSPETNSDRLSEKSVNTSPGTPASISRWNLNDYQSELCEDRMNAADRPCGFRSTVVHVSAESPTESPTVKCSDCKTTSIARVPDPDERRATGKFARIKRELHQQQLVRLAPISAQHIWKQLHKPFRKRRRKKKKKTGKSR